MEMFTLKTVAVANDGCPAIKEVMTKNPVTVSSNETVAEALYKMNQKNVLRLPVVTESGSVAGIIAKSDIKAKQAELAEFNAELPGSCPVAKLTKSAITINENKNVADAYNMLNDEDIKSLVVVDDFHRVIGMVTKNDIAKLQAKEEAKEAENQLEADIRKYVTNDDKLVKAIIDDFDTADAVALAIFKAPPPMPVAASKPSSNDITYIDFVARSSSSSADRFEPESNAPA